MAPPDDEEDLRLNTLNRFEKKSARLALEEYSHCEVPAGCGGVVLRWVDPSEGTPAVLMLAVVGRARGWLDGALLETGRTVIPAGEHVLALELERAEDVPSIVGAGAGILRSLTAALRGQPYRGVDLFAAALTPDVGEGDAAAFPGAATADDGTWLATAVAPEETWIRPEFDDAEWEPLAGIPPASVEAIPADDHSRWRFLDLVRVGASPLFLPRHAARLWVRKRFILAAREAPP